MEDELDGAYWYWSYLLSVSLHIRHQLADARDDLERQKRAVDAAALAQAAAVAQAAAEAKLEAKKKKGKKKGAAADPAPAAAAAVAASAAAAAAASAAAAVVGAGLSDSEKRLVTAEERDMELSMTLARGTLRFLVCRTNAFLPAFHLRQGSLSYFGLVLRIAFATGGPRAGWCRGRAVLGLHFQGIPIRGAVRVLQVRRDSSHSHLRGLHGQLYCAWP